MKLRLIVHAFLYLSVVLILLGGKAMADEELEYKVVKEYNAFELRQYAEHLVAETEVQSNFGDAGNRAFNTLAGFIGGQNRKKTEIAMTAPVNQQGAETESEKIAMTTPVTQEPGESTKSTYVVGFVMPAKYTRETLPEPTNPKVKIRSIPGKLMAVHKYSGSWGEDNYQKHKSILLKAVEKAKLKTVGKPVYARYNPPFVPWFLRRNEVMIEVEDTSKDDTSTNNTKPGKTDDAD